MHLHPSWMKGLTPDMVKKAEDELRETPEKKAEALKEIKILIQEEPGFGPLQDDEFLVRFLRAKKYDVDRAFNTLKNYYSFKSRYSGIVTDLTPQDLKFVFEMNKVFVPTKRARNGEGIIIVKAGAFDMEACTLEQHVAAGFIGVEVGLQTEATQVCGGIMVIDMKGMTWRKLMVYFNPTFITTIVRCIQDVMPSRVSGIHVVNEPVYFGSVFKLVKPIITKKLRSRLHFHSSDLKSLQEHLPPETLPKELGGYLGEEEFRSFRSMMLQNNALIERLSAYTYNGVKSSYQQTLEKENKSALHLTTKDLFNVSTN
ncbi:alpha-tocopherol transfer protein-like [Caerostris extrusa]|uniref:Alpha-tocopherol transfer protein-like n=1 Tax=Caerostris extrusa TaxID=172846 RepID=A0AAV4TWQ1_CAEEX|nr:alpha-tocopherol transfer protein-like [Caerostris extrusa]